ncbi:hypothetical protein [Dactylosporangium sp. NPDC049140]|uniref:ABC transporter permease subunit n=1 Tax=Dactylosporangium sp. NPDC049140 TaxID=3155647 RepID=UPI0033E874DA
MQQREAAYLSGVDVRRIPFMLFVLTAATAGLAVAVKASAPDSVAAGTSGLGFELTVLTAVLRGGVALTGGSGSLLGVLLGVVFLGGLQNGLTLLGVLLGVVFRGGLQNGLTLLGVPTFWQQMAQGGALVVGVGLAVLGPRLRGGRV